MTTINECPSLDDVATFLEGLAAPIVSDRILEHVDACTSCRSLLASLLRNTEGDTPSPNTSGTPQTFSVGEAVDARYRITRFISRGGMGEVYEAWDAQLQETIALKTIVCTGLDNAKLFAQLRAEVQLARRVTHSNVCRILEFGLQSRDYRGQTETVPFFTMELLQGETLAQLMDRRGILPETEVLEIALQVINGLAAVHAAGIVHRDLKPDNIFILPSETGVARVVVMDFGLARSVTKPSSLLSSDGTSPVGTPAYMAPEQTSGGPPSAAWDIYALGVILFKLLSGTFPFTGTSAVAMALAKMRERAPSLSSRNPQVRPGLCAVVGRCLRREPKERYANLAALRLAIVEAIQAPILPRRSGRLVVWLAVTLLGLTLSLVGALSSQTKSNRQRGRVNAQAIQQLSPLPRSMGSASSSDPAIGTADLEHGTAVHYARQMGPLPLDRLTAQKSSDAAHHATNAGPPKLLQPTRISSSLDPRTSASAAPTPASSQGTSGQTSSINAATTQDELAIPSFIKVQPKNPDRER